MSTSECEIEQIPANEKEGRGLIEPSVTSEAIFRRRKRGQLGK